MSRVLALLGVLALALACSEPQAPMTEERFVDVMVQLREAARGSTAADFEERRAQILEEAGVSEAQLREFVRLGSREPRGLAEVWDTVSARLNAAAPSE